MDVPTPIQLEETEETPSLETEETPSLETEELDAKPTDITSLEETVNTNISQIKQFDEQLTGLHTRVSDVEQTLDNTQVVVTPNSDIKETEIIEEPQEPITPVERVTDKTSVKNRLKLL